jgi:large subunit ribosomal protein L29
MKAVELRELSTEDLEKKIDEIEEELFNLRFKKAEGKPLENPKRLTILKKSIARIKTILNERKKSEDKK